MACHHGRAPTEAMALKSGNLLGALSKPFGKGAQQKLLVAPPSGSLADTFDQEVHEDPHLQ